MEISVETLPEYLIAQTDLFDANKPVAVTLLSRDKDSYIDGYINYLYLAKQEEKAYIIKHSKETISSGIALGKLDPARNYLEYMTFLLREGLAPHMVPEVYFADQENHLFIMEDLSAMKIVRFFLSRGEQPLFFGKNVGEFLARCHYFTSRLNLSQQQFADQSHYFENTDMRRIITDFILQPPLNEWDFDDEYAQAIHDVLEKILGNPHVRREWQELLGIFDTYKDCLIHGDFHTSNLFIGEQGIRVIDMEYSTTGPFAYDLGYFLANLLSQYAAFNFNSSFSVEANQEMAAYLLQMIQDVFTTYFDYFQTFHQRRHAGEDLAELFVSILQDALGYLAMANIGRTANNGSFPDFDCIEKRKEWFLAKGLSMKIAGELLLRRKEIQTPQEAIELMKDVREIYFEDICLTQR